MAGVVNEDSATQHSDCFPTVGCREADRRLVRIVHISDTHLKHNLLLDKIPDGDILIHSGDFSRIAWSRYIFRQKDFLEEVEEIRSFFCKLPHKYKIFVAGNHEVNFERNNLAKTVKLFGEDVIYLQDSFVVIEGIKIYGTPWNGLRHNSHARGFAASFSDLGKYWKGIPEDTDILVTHMPPLSVLDLGILTANKDRICKVCQESHPCLKHVGCPKLLDQVLCRVKPKVHLYGHVHECNGTVFREGTLFSNAAMVSTPEARVINYYLPASVAMVTDSRPQCTVDNSRGMCCVM